MKKIKIKDIDWYIEEEAIKDALKDTLSRTGSNARERRGYKVIKLNDKTYFLKSFNERGVTGFFRRLFYPRGKKEYLMGKALLSLSVLTPEPLGYGVSKDGSFVLERYISGKNFLELFYNSENKKELISQLAVLLRNLTLHKIRHNDLHLNNILVEDGKLYIIDLHKMEIKRHFSLSDEASNISHCLAMIYKDLSEDEKEEFFSCYGTEGVREIVEAAINDMRKKWIEKKKKRAFEETSIVKREKDIFYIKGTRWQKGDSLLESIKKDKKVEVYRYADHIRKFYRDKRRLKRAWEAYVVLSYMSFKVTPEVFFLKLPGPIRAGFIAMEDLKGTGQELDRFLDRFYRQMELKERAVFIEKLSNFLRHLFERNIFHKDFKACNIFVRESDGFLLLDMEDIVFKSIEEKDLIKVFLQLNTTIPKYIRNTDRLRFFLKIIDGYNINRKEMAIRIGKASLDMDIVYEGVNGLKIERFR